MSSAQDDSYLFMYHQIQVYNVDKCHVAFSVNEEILQKCQPLGFLSFTAI